MIYVRLFRSALILLLLILNDALVEHGVGNLDKSGNVCADHEIAGFSVLFRGLPRDFEDRRHDVTQS